jgi:HAD superfamily hydrolase (TIGR01549 family)
MPFELKCVRGICFDVDGTLNDTDNEWAAALQQKLHGVRFLFKNHDPLSFSRWMMLTAESPANAVYHLLDHLSLDEPFARLYERLIRSRKSSAHSFMLMDHARELLEFLAQRYPCSIVSARDEGTTRSFVEQFGLGSYFRAIVTSQTCPHTKPFPDPVIYAAQQMGLQLDECVMIGDTTVDILAGKAAGAQTIGVLCGFGSESELRRAGADLIVKDLHEVMGAFEGSSA